MTDLKDAIKQAVTKQMEEVKQAMTVEFIDNKVIMRLEYSLTDMEKDIVRIFIEEGIEKALEWIQRERKRRGIDVVCLL